MVKYKLNEKKYFLSLLKTSLTHSDKSFKYNFHPEHFGHCLSVISDDIRECAYNYERLAGPMRMKSGDTYHYQTYSSFSFIFTK